MRERHNALLTTPSPATVVNTSVYNSTLLSQRAHWIRNTLDPLVAREGEDALHADDILELDDLLRRLLYSTLELGDLRRSRIHLAVLKICGRATRWPRRLVERCEEIKEVWEKRLGLQALATVGIELFGEGGRLHGVCGNSDLSLGRELLLAKWLKEGGGSFSPLKSLRVGDLGFVPGDWWINALFAFRDGVINHGDDSGGICWDSRGAYAVVLTGSDESSSQGPESFTYRARPDDKGRYRLTAATLESRSPVRILRHHSLHSFWAPKAGLRYDGLYQLSGWTIKFDPKLKTIVYFITFVRLPNQLSMKVVLCRPWVEEVEDYKEYRRLRQVARREAKVEAAMREECGNLQRKSTIDCPTVDGATSVSIPNGVHDHRAGGSLHADGRLVVVKTRRGVLQRPSASASAVQHQYRRDSTCTEKG